MEQTKQCSQCGMIKPITKFRKYYKSSGLYTHCKDCEKINSREKYLTGKESKTAEDCVELSEIHDLWEIQREKGLRPPRRRKEISTNVARIIAEQKHMLENQTKTIDFPMESTNMKLEDWLVAQLTEEPEYYLDTVYERLLEKYRPMLYIAKGTLEPVYDTKYQDILSKILERFNEYEDEYYGL